MNYLSVCSGIEAATVAWHDMGWNPLAFSEIEKFPSQVLAHHYPNTPNLGDMTKFKEWDFGTNRLDLLVGGTPCQSFSVAGLRKGLEDPRGNLALTYVAILDKFRPKWCVWENVPGVLSSGKGRDFGAFLGALGELGYGWSYRVLDAQYFGVAQRRKRVFVVGCSSGWKFAAKVLFESESLSRNIEKGRKKREETSESAIPSIANCIQTTCNDYSRADGFNMIATGAFGKEIADTVTAKFAKGAELLQQGAQNGGNCVLQPIHCVDTFPTLLSSTAGVSRPGNAVTEHQTYIAYQTVGVDTYNASESGDIAVTLTASGNSSTNSGPKVMQDMAVRRLTPVECERLQGFPDDYTNIPKAVDGPRYKALGNSMAVPVMKWIGQRIQQVENGLI
jgi:DNA (cytosine-5)-methyltransferase 1